MVLDQGMADSAPIKTSTAPADRRAKARQPFRRERRPQERVRLLGQPVDLVRPEEVLHHMERWIAEGSL